MASKKIRVCVGPSCSCWGGDALIERLKERLGIQIGETTADGAFTLEEEECFGACGSAPVVEIDGQEHEALTPEKLDAILDSL